MEGPFPLDRSWITGGLKTSWDLAIAKFFATLGWWLEGFFIQSLVDSMKSMVVGSQTSIVYLILQGDGGTAGASFVLDDIIGFTTLAGFLLIIIRSGMIIFNAYLLNLEGGETVPVLEYVKRIFFAIIFLIVSPSLILNGFILITVIASSAASGSSSSISNFSLLNSNPYVNKVIDKSTFCIDANPDLNQAEIETWNSKQSKILLLGTYESMGGAEGMPGSVNDLVSSGLMTDEQVKSFIDDANGVFCRGQGAIESPSIHGFSVKDNSKSGFTTTVNADGQTVVFENEVAWSVYDSLMLDDATFSQTGIRTGRVKSMTEIMSGKSEQEADGGQGVLSYMGGGIGDTILTIGLAIVSLVYIVKFAFGIAERTIDIFATIWTSFLYASAYVSNKNNQMIGNLIKRVMAIYLTHLFEIIFFSYWFSSIATRSFSMLIKILVTVGFMRVIKKGNTAIKEYMDKTSEGTALKGAKNIASNLLSRGGK